MAKDDYFVLAYKILAYLYTQLKAGMTADAAMLDAGSVLIGVNKRYHAYIMESLQQQGYIRGVCFITPWGGETLIESLEECQITPQGIEYLLENSLMQKTKRFLKDVKEITPFI